jgi:hypothetical protein
LEITAGRLEDDPLDDLEDIKRLVLWIICSWLTRAVSNKSHDIEETDMPMRNRINFF